jgi:hypothetical protein
MMLNLFNRGDDAVSGYSDTQVKVLQATLDEPWYPEQDEMAEISQLTFDRYIEDVD